MKLKKPLTNQRGVVLVVALVLLLVLTLIGISSVSTSTFETINGGNERLYNMAFYAADAGIEHFRSRLLNGDVINETYHEGPTAVGANTYEVRVLSIWNDGGANCYKVRSVGTAPNFPVDGRVEIEAIIETGGAGGGGGSNSEPY